MIGTIIVKFHKIACLNVSFDLYAPIYVVVMKLKIIYNTNMVRQWVQILLYKRMIYISMSQHNWNVWSTNIQYLYTVTRGSYVTHHIYKQ